MQIAALTSDEAKHRALERIRAECMAALVAVIVALAILLDRMLRVTRT